ncbi:MAG: hypothetical protein WCH98_23585 [Verrucomicrobiota bacterium]
MLRIFHTRLSFDAGDIPDFGAHIVAAAFLIELADLGGRKVLGDAPVTAIESYA